MNEWVKDVKLSTGMNALALTMEGLVDLKANSMIQAFTQLVCSKYASRLFFLLLFFLLVFSMCVAGLGHLFTGFLFLTVEKNLLTCLKDGVRTLHHSH